MATGFHSTSETIKAPLYFRASSTTFPPLLDFIVPAPASCRHAHCSKALLTPDHPIPSSLPQNVLGQSAASLVVCVTSPASCQCVFGYPHSGLYKCDLVLSGAVKPCYYPLVSRFYILQHPILCTHISFMVATSACGPGTTHSDSSGIWFHSADPVLPERLT